MSKITLVVFLLLASFQLAKSQQLTDQVPDHTPMMNATWELINTLMYKVEGTGNNKTYTPHFPDKLKSLNNKTVTLPGYLVPLNAGRNHDNFMISVLPIMQCMFCGTNDIPPMVEVFLKNGTKIRYTEDPIKIKGRMHLNSNIHTGNSEIQIFDAEIVK